MKGLGKLFASIALAASFAGASTVHSLAQEQWTAYSHLSSANTTAAKALQHIADDFAAATNGQIVTQVNVGGQLPIASNAVTQAVGDGVIQLADNGYYSGDIPIGGILGLPLLVSTPAEYDAALKVWTPHLATEFDKRGVVLLAAYTFPSQVLFSTKEITALDGYVGLKVRPSSPEQAEFIRRFGGVPISTNSSEIASALQTGTIDALFTASSSGGTTYKDLWKYNYRLGLNYFVSLFVVNKDTFEGLSQEHQTALKDIAQRRAAEASQIMSESEGAATQALAAAGVTVSEPSADDSAKAVQTISSFWDDWGKSQSAETQAVLAEVRAAIGK